MFLFFLFFSCRCPSFFVVFVVRVGVQTKVREKIRERRRRLSKVRGKGARTFFLGLLKVEDMGFPMPEEENPASEIESDDSIVVVSNNKSIHIVINNQQVAARRKHASLAQQQHTIQRNVFEMHSFIKSLILTCVIDKWHHMMESFMYMVRYSHDS